MESNAINVVQLLCALPPINASFRVQNLSDSVCHKLNKVAIREAVKTGFNLDQKGLLGKPLLFR